MARLDSPLSTKYNHVLRIHFIFIEGICNGIMTQNKSNGLWNKGERDSRRKVDVANNER